MAKCAATDPEGTTASCRISLVPSKATGPNVTSASDTPVASTNLNRGAGNTERSLRNWVQLVSISSWFPYGRTDLCEDNTILDTLLRSLFGRSSHQWRVFLQQSFKFVERQAQRFRLL
jgi:hypothetical protein